MEYRHGSHTVYNIEYHFVWITKYRYKVLTGDVGQRVRELVRQTCTAFEIQILKGVVSKSLPSRKRGTMYIFWFRHLQIWHRAKSCGGSKDVVRASFLRNFQC